MKRTKKNKKKEEISDDIVIISDSEDSEVIVLDPVPSNSTAKLLSNTNRAPSPILFQLESDDVSTNKENIIEELRKDWETPQSTPNKDEKNTTLGYITSKSGTKKSIVRELSQSVSECSVSSDFSLLSNSNSEDEFELCDVKFHSPSPRMRKKKFNSPGTSKTTPSKFDFKKTLSQNKVDSWVPKREVSASFCDSSNNSFESSRTNRSMLVTPIRTPTPSPETYSKSVSKKFNLSQDIQISPDKFNVKRSLSNLKEECDSNVKIEVTSPFIESSHKRTPRSVLKSSQNTFQGSCVSPSFVRVRRKLNISFEDSSQGSSQRSMPEENPSLKYRNNTGMYLENLFTIIDTVLSQPEDLKLFNSDDLNVVKGFHALTLESQKLYARLFQRKIKWSRVSKLDYKEICDKEDIYLYINELVYAEFLLSEKSLTDLKEYLLLLDVAEIKKICKDMKISTVGNKDDLMSKLLKCEKQQKSITSFFQSGSGNQSSKLMKMAKEMVGRCYLLNKTFWNVFMRIILLYSPPSLDEDEELGQKIQLTQLLMMSLGKLKFPKYEVNRCHSLYQSRDDVLRFQEILQIESSVQECFKKQDWEEAIELCKSTDQLYLELQNNEEIMKHDTSLPPFLRRFTTLSLLCYIQSLAVEAYQRLKQYGKAVKQLERLLDQKTHLQDSRGRWYDRLALNLEKHLKRTEKCLKVIEEGLNDPEVRVGHRLALSQRAERLLASKKNQKLGKDANNTLCLITFREAPKVYIQGKSLPSDIPGYKRIFIDSGLDREGDAIDTMCSVEELVLSYYKKEGYPKGLHCEARTVRGLFGFFFWKILYLPIPDAFRTNHQGAPLDLDSPHFYSARKELIDKRLKKMKRWSLEEANQVVEKVWRKFENSVSIIDWKIFSSLEFTQGLVAGLGLKLIAAICQRLIEDHRFTRSGFPDLIVWNPEEKKSRIVEVKGPNDKLSTKQQLWLDYLLQHGAEAEVCHVEAVGAKRRTALNGKRVSPRKRDASAIQGENRNELAGTSTTRTKRKRIG